MYSEGAVPASALLWSCSPHTPAYRTWLCAHFHHHPQLALKRSHVSLCDVCMCVCVWRQKECQSIALENSRSVFYVLPTDGQPAPPIKELLNSAVILIPASHFHLTSFFFSASVPVFSCLPSDLLRWNWPVLRCQSGSVRPSNAPVKVYGGRVGSHSVLPLLPSISLAEI